MTSFMFRIISIVSTLSFVVIISNGEEGVMHKLSSIEESVLKFTLRTFTNPSGRWVTQVRVQRGGFREEGALPRVLVSVEQNATEASQPPRLAARLAVAPRLDEQAELPESDRFELLARPPKDWERAGERCQAADMHLAVPSPAAEHWLRSALHKARGDAGDIRNVYIGISNTHGSAFETVLGQIVTNGTIHLHNGDLLCGVLKVSETPYTILFNDCSEDLPFVCEKRQTTVSPLVDISPWLKQDFLKLLNSFFDERDI